MRMNGICGLRTPPDISAATPACAKTAKESWRARAGRRARRSKRFISFPGKKGPSRPGLKERAGLRWRFAGVDAGRGKPRPYKRVDRRGPAIGVQCRAVRATERFRNSFFEDVGGSA